MLDLTTAIVTIIFIVFVIGPVIAGGVLVAQSHADFAQPQDYKLEAAVAGTIAGTWIGILGYLVMSRFVPVHFTTSLIADGASALLGGLIGRYGEFTLPGRRGPKLPM